MNQALQIPSWPQADAREAELLRMVLDSLQWGGFHPFVSEFEQSFAAYQHSKYGISAANGTLTLEAALEALGIGRGDEVIVPAISFISSATSVSRVGATPVFVDIEGSSFNIDPERVRDAISSQTKAVMVVHFGGAMCDMDALSAICIDAGLILIEDAAHAHGSEWKGKRAGSFGQISSFSFQNGKCLTSGEGGMLVTSDTSLEVLLRSLINCGRTLGRSFYEHATLGSNYRMTAFQAAVLLAQFERLPQQIARRSANVAVLQHELESLAELAWQSISPHVTQNCWYLLVGRLSKGREARDRLMTELASHKVPCTPFYPHPLYRNPLYQSRACRVMPCPEAEARIKDSFWLPHRVLLAEEETIRSIAHLMVRGLSRN